MIFKIEIEIKDIKKYIEIFRKDFDILFSKKLYIATKVEKKMSVNSFKKKYNLNQNLKIDIMDIDSVKQESIFIQSWFRDINCKYDLLRFEKKEQEKIKQTLFYLDNLENELKKISEQSVVK